LVPGTAFDSSGHRIGYGKGYYDRLLKKTTSSKIGIAYDFQIVKKVPAENHDIKMTQIVTDKKIYNNLT
jgi:5-formyltetrahydrofolate cyclo-ligase